MNKIYKKIVLLLGIFLLLFFIVFVVNQTAQIVQLAEKVSPKLGQPILWVLLMIYAVLILTPLVLFLRLPKSLSPPRSEESPEFNAYLEGLKKRLASNPYLKGQEISNRQQVEVALAVLAKQADAIIQQTAATLFISTAISQSGRLDAFLVLSAQSSMVWRIAHVYYQRPMLRDLIYLYANIAGTAFLASELDELNVSEQVKPILSSTLGALAVTVPGFQLAATLLVNSVLTGTANAFLTLRIGVIAKRYCGSLVVADKGLLRRMASAEAAKLLGSIVKQGSANLSKALWEASKGKVGDTFSDVAGFAKDAGNSLLSKAGFRKNKETLLAGIDASTDTTHLPSSQTGKPEHKHRGSRFFRRRRPKKVGREIDNAVLQDRSKTE